MDKINRFIKYYHNQSFLIENNKDEIEHSNYNIAFGLMTLGDICYFALIFVSLFVDAYRSSFVPYIIAFSTLTILLSCFNFLRKHLASFCLIYSIYGILIGFTTYSSGFVSPEYTSVLILLFYLLLPICIIDKSWRVNTVLISYMLFYMIIAIPNKDARLISDEIVDCIIFVILGIGTGEFLRMTRLENFELKRQALLREKTDYLTGLGNRKSLFQYLHKLHKDSKKRNRIQLIMIDIDNFKRYNDTYGHQAGDSCLATISNCFQSFGRKYKIKFFRYGGEEFVGVTTHYDASGLSCICEKLNIAVTDMKIPHIKNIIPFVTISIGISSMSLGIKEYNDHILISQADHALYSAKKQGRNQTVHISAVTD